MTSPMLITGLKSAFECGENGISHSVTNAEESSFLNQRSPLSNDISSNGEKKGMCSPKQFLVGHHRSGHRWRLASCLNYRRMTTPRFRNIVRCGSNPMVNA